MAAPASFVHFDALLAEVENDYFNLNSRDYDSEDDNSDWTSACAEDRAVDIELEADEDTSQHENAPIINNNMNNNNNETADIEVDAAGQMPTALESTTPTSVSTKVAQLENFYRSSNCKCHANFRNCLQQFEFEKLNLQAVLYISFTHEQLDICLLSKIFTFINISNTVGKSHRHKEKDRHRTSLQFIHEGEQSWK